jgi:hypothetical protein
LQTFNTWVISKVCIIVSNFNDAIIVKMAVGNVSDLASERKLPAQELSANRCQMHLFSFGKQAGCAGLPIVVIIIQV